MDMPAMGGSTETATVTAAEEQEEHGHLDDFPGDMRLELDTALVAEVVAVLLLVGPTHPVHCCLQH